MNWDLYTSSRSLLVCLCRYKLRFCLNRSFFVSKGIKSKGQASTPSVSSSKKHKRKSPVDSHADGNGKTSPIDSSVKKTGKESSANSSLKDSPLRGVTRKKIAIISDSSDDEVYEINKIQNECVQKNKAPTVQNSVSDVVELQENNEVIPILVSFNGIT